MQTEPDQGFDHIGSPSPPPTTVTPNDRLSPTFEQWIHSARKGRRNAVANILNDGYTPRITTDLSMGIEKLSCSVCIQSVIGKTNCFTCDASSKCTHCRQRGTFQFRPFSSSAYRFICHLAMLRSLLGRTLTIDYISNHFGRYFASKQSQVTMINNNEPESSFKPRKALVLSKFSRYELEKRRFPHLSEEELSMKLEKRGSDYQGLIHHHNIHSASKNKLKSVLESRGIEVKFINRFEYNRAVIDWADVIFTTGGDGTFLAAASLIKSPNKTVIGINSDPSRSVGYLCLPQPYSSDLDATLDKLCSGQFKWLFRQRIRITLQGENALDDPLELHKQQLNCGSDYLGSGEVEEIKEFPTSPEAKNIPEGSWRSCQLPVRALNEVFVGENHSARVSYCELTVDDRPRVKFRSSGVAVCTGTGSTSWSFNISRIPKQTVQSILEIAKAKNGDNSKLQDSFVDDVTKEFNDSLVFEPEKLAMAYTIRDPQILDDNFLPSRAFAQRIEIKSRMDDACVVIDGGLSYRFNDGNIACFEMKEEDALRTVNIL